MNSKYLKRHQEELGRRNVKITPVCIVVDKSHSMINSRFTDRYGKTRMERLNEGIQLFFKEISEDDRLYDSVEVAIVSFDVEVKEELKFSTIENIDNVVLTGGPNAGDTPKGVEYALKVLEKEKEFLKGNTEYNQPWIVIFSDGRATPGVEAIDFTGRKNFTDIDNRLKKVQTKIKNLEADGKLTVIPVLISEPTDGQYKIALKQMRGFTNKNTALVLGDNQNSLSFKDFFVILGKSISVGSSALLFASQSGDVDVPASNEEGEDDYVNQEDDNYQKPKFASDESLGASEEQEDNEAQKELERLKSEAKNKSDEVTNQSDNQVDEEQVNENNEEANEDLDTKNDEATDEDSKIDDLFSKLVDWDNL